MDKSEVLDYITEHNRECGGNLTTERGFRKHFPELYEEMMSVEFPGFFDGFDFKQKLWHFLRDDYTEHICGCGGKLKFRSFWFGYNSFCRMNCPAMVRNQVKCVKERSASRTEDEKKEIQRKVRDTFLERYGVERYSQTDEWKRKTIEKNREKFGSDWVSQSNGYRDSFRKTCLEKYGVENPFQAQECKEKSRKTCLKKYGVENYVKTDEYNKKAYETKKMNNSFNTSKIEELFSEYLSNKGIRYIRQYHNDLYPFNCDFYIPEYNLYLEIQGSWTHGRHQFNPEDKNDIKTLEYWKSKNSKFYTNAIEVWTVRDPLKRRTAEENGLNYLEVFSSDIDEVIMVFEDRTGSRH